MTRRYRIASSTSRRALESVWPSPFEDDPAVMAAVKWTHWDDLRNIYGVDADGYGRSTWDNVGVQYGLQALTEGKITPAEFLKLNANAGSWKDSKGVLVVAVQESFSSGSAREDVEGMAIGFTDPLNPQARNGVRFEQFNGLGNDAAGFVERADAARGILSDGAMLSIRRGEHTIWVMSNQLSRRDRTAALKTLQELGQAAARRL